MPKRPAEAAGSLSTEQRCQVLASWPIQVGHQLVELVQAGPPHLGDLARRGYCRFDIRCGRAGDVVQIIACGEAAGLIPVDRCVALLGRVDDRGRFVARGSFFQRDFIAKQRRLGLPLHLIAHEDVVILQRERTGSSSENLKQAQGEAESSVAGSSGFGACVRDEPEGVAA